jgi:hypothetical protein
MTITQAIRNSAKWLFVVIGALLVVTRIISDKHRPEIAAQLQAECRAKYAAAHSRGDSILADNWIPAPGLQATRTLWHCGQLMLGRHP